MIVNCLYDIKEKEKSQNVYNLLHEAVTIDDTDDKIYYINKEILDGISVTVL